MNAGKVEDYRPVRFLDQLEGNNHIVLLYDNQLYADLIIARYLLNGLKKGESCAFFTADETEDVEARLCAGGIDVEEYERKNSLRIHHAELSYSNQLEALSTLRGLREELTRGMKPPYRFVGRTIPVIESKDGMRLGLLVERSGHAHFREFDNSQMCPYDISRIEQTMRDEWIKELLRNHHHAIYASEPDKAVAFQTSLLEPAD